MTTLTRLHPQRRRKASLMRFLTMTGALMTGLAACSSAGDGDAASEGSDTMTSSEVAPSERCARELDRQ